VSSSKPETISAVKVGFVSAIAARKSSVRARWRERWKCSRSKARCAALRAANSMSAGVKS